MSNRTIEGESIATSSLASLVNSPQRQQEPQGDKQRVPLLVVRQGQGQGKQNVPDIYLGWLNWSGLSPFKPFTDPIAQTLGPYSQQLSSMLLGRFPPAQQIATQFDQLGNQLSGAFNPQSLMNLGQGLPSPGSVVQGISSGSGR